MKTTTFNVPLIFEKNVAKAGVSEGAKMSFIFTDSDPNGNNQGISAAEFPNLVKTGKFKPVKIGESGGHFDAYPIGVITDMQESGRQILGAASLWDTEFPELIDEMKKAAIAGSPLQTSWEILYENSEVDDSGVEWLVGCSTKAVAVVDTPAYAGRTPVLALAQQTQKGDNLMDEKETKELIGKAAKLEAEVEALSADKKALEESVAEAKAALEEFVVLKEELETLRKFKQDAEEAQRLGELRAARLGKFQEAGIQMPEDEFTANSERWLSMDDEAFNFVLQTLAIRQTAAPATASLFPFMSNTGDQETPEQVLRKSLFKQSEEK